MRNLCIVHLMLDAGFRRSDVVNLRYSNISFTNNYIMIQGKGCKYRTVPLCSRLKKMLSHYLIKYRCCDPDDDFMVFTKVGTREPLTSESVKQLFARIKRNSGIERIHPHLLRHTFATSYIYGGGNIEFLRMMLGHEDYETTKLYLHVAEMSKMLHFDIYKLDPVFFKSGY
jgi:integrase/recombinase XerC/integrase/recombinase XerD